MLTPVPRCFLLVLALVPALSLPGTKEQVQKTLGGGRAGGELLEGHLYRPQLSAQGLQASRGPRLNRPSGHRLVTHPTRPPADSTVTKPAQGSVGGGGSEKDMPTAVTIRPGTAG